MQLVGITGFKRCGKGTTSEVLHKHFGFHEYAFADALRRIGQVVNPVISLQRAPQHIIDAMDDPDEARYNDLLRIVGYERAKEVPDFRGFLQKLGTEGIRECFGPNAWVDALARRIEAEGYPRVVINDVRFQSEAEWILARGGILWRVVRPGVGGDDPHPSEVEIPNLPATREISATNVQDLEAAVLSAAREDIGLSL